MRPRPDFAERLDAGEQILFAHPQPPERVGALRGCASLPGVLLAGGAGYIYAKAMAADAFRSDPSSGATKLALILLGVMLFGAFWIFAALGYPRWFRRGVAARWALLTDAPRLVFIEEMKDGSLRERDLPHRARLGPNDIGFYARARPGLVLVASGRATHFCNADIVMPEDATDAFVADLEAHLGLEERTVAEVKKMRRGARPRSL